jgi:hypothetical protein
VSKVSEDVDLLCVKIGHCPGYIPITRMEGQRPECGKGGEGEGAMQYRWKVGKGAIRKYGVESQRAISDHIGVLNVGIMNRR